MTSQLVHEAISGIDAPYGFGELQNVGRVEGEQILQDYKKFALDSDTVLAQIGRLHSGN